VFVLLQDDAEAGIRLCAEWVRAHGATVADGAGAPAHTPAHGPAALPARAAGASRRCCGAGDAPPLLDCRSSKGQLAMPVPEAAVAHGDANLKIEEFLSRTLRA